MSSKEISLRELIHPTPRQEEFFLAVDKYEYVLYGGAKSGGKSYILRWALIRQLLKWAREGHKNVRVGLFCEDYPALKDRQITKIKKEFPAWLGKLSDSQIEGMSFVLEPQFGGGILALRNLDDPSKYASSEFAAIGVDELTKNLRETFDELRSIKRWPGIENTKFMGATNPGQIGGSWVKKLWIDREFTKEDPKPEQIFFVKSLPTDNPHNANSYIEELKALPDKKRKAYFEGNWDSFEGQFFEDWNKEVHVVEPFAVPVSWKKIRVIDPSGRRGVTASYILAINYDGDVYVTHEHYKTGLDADQHAMKICNMSADIYPQYTAIDTSAFSKIGLPETIAEVYERHGVTGLVPSDKKRETGWNTFHQYLRWEEKPNAVGEIIRIGPKLKVFKTCPNLIRTIPLAIHNENRPEDVADMENPYTDSEGRQGYEHMDGLDAIRYGLQTLREARSPQPLNIVERRLLALKAREDVLRNR